MPCVNIMAYAEVFVWHLYISLQKVCICDRIYERDHFPSIFDNIIFKPFPQLLIYGSAKILGTVEVLTFS